MHQHQWRSTVRGLTAATAALLATQALAQNQAPFEHMKSGAHPSFAVATIKPHDPASQRAGFSSNSDRVYIRNESVASMTAFAYGLNKQQILNAAGWADGDTYDVQGKADVEGQPNLHQEQEMVQKLLADRFQLKFHYEKRELSVYAVRVAKVGARLAPAAKPDNQLNQIVDSNGNVLTVQYTSCSMPDFAFGEQPFLDRPVVDQTGLAGRYDFTLRYTADESRASDDPNAPPDIFTAVQEQLGLKLEPAKAQADVLVIDRVEKPSAN